MDKFRFFTLLESKSGNLKPLISENKLKEESYLQKKQETTPVSQQNKCSTHIIAPKEEIKQINT